MFIHGGGFNGGTKQKPEIVAMANYYASRGWVFVSIDYRTSEELGVIEGLSPKEILTYYRGIVPEEWVEKALEGAQSLDQFKQAIAMYLAQRDAKAALRWIVANSEAYKINKDFIRSSLTVNDQVKNTIASVTSASSLQVSIQEYPYIACLCINIET